jgi:HSP20 family protein
MEYFPMTTLTRWNPFKTSTRFDPVATFDDLFRGLSTRPLWRDFEAAPDIRIEVNENDKAYQVKAEIPGVEKNDIEVSVEGNQVAISGEVKRETKKKDDEKEVYSERYYGKVYRSFTLPTDLDSAKADAHYEGGVLMLTLPKKQNGSSRKISVS